jgi:imidazolonepropionase-like amidohydrolase
MEINVKKTHRTFTKGFAAEAIATPENPLQNLLALRKVMFVMKNGKIFRHDKSTIRQTLEEQNN